MVVGRLVVEDGKQDPEMVMAQMPILKEGYFAGEVGDLARPIAFRSHGYQNLDVPLKGKTGDLVYLGDVTLKPLPESGGSSLRGKIVLDAPKDSESPSVSLSIMVGEPNTPHNGYSPRRGWPKPLELPVSKEGEFSATGLSPARYYLSISAKGHVDTSKMMSFESGKLLDVGTIHLRSTDLGLYVGKPAPKAKELAWEKDYPAALKRARDEKKPMLVMMTATWCGPCKLLEKETLSDPWVRHFLSGFVVVKAYEDKDVEEKYGLNGYPTLVFTDPAASLPTRRSATSRRSSSPVRARRPSTTSAGRCPPSCRSSWTRR